MSSAFATNDTNLDLTKANGDAINGTGVAANHFVLNTAPALAGGGNISVAVKPRDRDTGQANSIAGNVYQVDPGSSSTNPARPNLVFDWQFNPGLDSTTNYVLRYSLDYDPAPGAAAFTTVSHPIFGSVLGDSWQTDPAADKFKVNPGGAAWNPSTTPYSVNDTTNHDFNVPPLGFVFNRNAAGEYEFKLEVLDPTGTNVLASADAFAVVPEPGTLSVLGIGAVGMLARRRGRVLA